MASIQALTGQELAPESAAGAPSAAADHVLKG